jgi:hypothetical protein
MYVMINGKTACTSRLTLGFNTMCAYSTEAQARADFEKCGWFEAHPNDKWEVVEGNCPRPDSYDPDWD